MDVLSEAEDLRLSRRLAGRRPAGRRRRAVRREVLADSTDLDGGIDGNDCQGGRHQQNRMTGRQRAAGPDERTRRENPASPVQVGPPVTDQSTGRPSTVCVRPGTGDVKPVLWPDSPGRFRGPGHAKIASTAQRSAGSEKLVRPRKSGTAQTAPSGDARAGPGGTRRWTQEDRRMSGPEPWVAT